jgi:hypothetical protein
MHSSQPGLGKPHTGFHNKFSILYAVARLGKQRSERKPQKEGTRFHLISFKSTSAGWRFVPQEKTIKQAAIRMRPPIMMPVWILRVLCRPASVTRGVIQGEADARTISTIYGATLAHLSGGDARPTLKRTHMPAAIMAPDTMRTPMPVGEWLANRPVCASHRQVVAAPSKPNSPVVTMSCVVSI